MCKKSCFRVIVALLVLAIGIVSVQAADYVKVSTSDGNATFFSLDEKPTVSFTAKHLVLTTSTVEIEYPIADYRSFEFVAQTVGVNDVADKVVFSVGNSLTGKGLPAGSEVSLYSSAGNMVGRAVVSESGCVEIPLHGQTGVFIVKSVSKTFKFIKKS